jgi:hypothetical protein
MEVLPGTPLSSLASESDLASAAQLYGFLGKVLGELRSASSMAHMDSYATLLNSLVENFLMKVPEPLKTTWTSHSEAIKLTERSVDIIEQVILKVEGFLEANATLLPIVLNGLFHLACILNIWISESKSYPQPGVLTSPTSLKQKVICCSASIIIHLSNPVKIALTSRLHHNLHVSAILDELVEAGKGSPCLSSRS